VLRICPTVYTQNVSVHLTSMTKSLLIIFSFISINGFCQSLMERQAEVLAEVEKIDALKDLKYVSFENEDFLEHMTDGGGKLIGYYSNNKLIKIRVVVGLSYGIETSEYYFNADSLFFVRETYESFQYVDSLESFNYETKEVSFIGQYVFNNNQVIDLESLGHYKFEDYEIDIERTIISEMIKYRSFLNDKTHANNK